MEGLKVIYNASVYEARDLEHAAELVAEFYPTPTRARARVTLTQDRPLTHKETLQLADLAAALLTRVSS